MERFNLISIKIKRKQPRNGTVTCRKVRNRREQPDRWLSATGQTAVKDFSNRRPSRPLTAMSGSGQMKTLTEGPKTRNFNSIRKKIKSRSVKKISSEGLVLSFKLTRLILIEFNLLIYRSIALDVFYQKSFVSNSVRVAILLQIGQIWATKIEQIF